MASRSWTALRHACSRPWCTACRRTASSRSARPTGSRRCGWPWRCPPKAGCGRSIPTAVAQSYFERAGVAGKIDITNQPAAEVLENFPHRNLDIVFLDANKEQYPQYLELCVPMLKLSGLMIVDNLLWSGRAAAEPKADDPESTVAIRRFNELFLNHPQLDATIVPV